MFNAMFGLVGALLAQRFNVFSLVPTTMLALLSTGVIGAIEGTRVLSIFVAMFGVCAVIQFGYFAGILRTRQL